MNDEELEWQEGRSDLLGLDYLYDHERIRFEDGVNYTMSETVRLARECSDDVRAMHTVRRIFEAEDETSFDDYDPIPLDCGTCARKTVCWTMPGSAECRYKGRL